MQNKDYLLPGVAAIFVAVISPIYWIGMSSPMGDFALGQDMLSLGFPDILFASILLLTIYIYLNLKNILNEQLNFNHIDLLVLDLWAAINILWMSTLFLDIASAVLPENIVTQNEGTFLNIGLSMGHRCNCHIRYHRFVNRYFTSSEVN